MEKIIGLGNALVDVLAPLDNDNILSNIELPKGSMQLIDDIRLKQVSEMARGMQVNKATGGSAGNTIKALAGLGIRSGFIGKIGNDETGRFYAESCRQKGIAAIFCSCPMPSGIAYTFISPDGERTFGTYLGAAAQLRADDLLSEMFRGYSYLYIEGYLVQNHPLILRAIELAKSEGLQICLDLASYNIVEQDREFFARLTADYVDIIFANEEETRAFTGVVPQKGIDHIAKQCSIAIVKLGSKGSLIKRGTDLFAVEAYPVAQVTDTTGAGDYYAAGFLYGLIRGLSIPKCGKIGSLLAGYIIQEIGATLPDVKWNEIKLKIQSILTD